MFISSVQEILDSVVRFTENYKKQKQKKTQPHITSPYSLFFFFFFFFPADYTSLVKQPTTAQQVNDNYYFTRERELFVSATLASLLL